MVKVGNTQQFVNLVIKMILIGSRSLKLRAPNLLKRATKDFDWMCSQDEFDNWIETQSHKVNPTKIYSPKEGKMVVLGDTNCEFEIIKQGTSSELFASLVSKDSDTIESPFGLIPGVDLFFTLKSSHKYLKNSPHFWKTLTDYHIMKMAGASIKPEYMEFFKLREKETYNYSHPKLNTSKENFFSDDGLKYVYDHDDIHKSVAHLSKPAYLYYMKDGSEVLSSKKKFFECSNEVRLFGVVEEAAVLAIERSLVPHPNTWSPEYAWKFALSKVCSSITSSWFREFSYNNALDILKLYPTGYWEKFQKDVSLGLVRSFKS